MPVSLPMFTSRKTISVGIAVAFVLLIAYPTLRVLRDASPQIRKPSSNLQRLFSWQNSFSLPHKESEKAPPKETHPSVLRGKPTMKFRDNLRNDTKYITSWLSAGWTNDVMTYGNLIYLALKTKRVPIIGVFTASEHIGFDKPPIFFGDVFDVPRLSASIGVPVVEWRQVKDPKSQEVDDLGCWTVWPASDLSQTGNRHSAVPEVTKLDISYTDAPKWIRLVPDNPSEYYVSFSALASLGFPDSRKSNLVAARPSPINRVTLPPDEQLLCYDFLFFVSDLRVKEFEWDYYPAWHHVIQYIRWLPALETLADGYVRRTIGTPDGEPTPPWITIHMRHGDFINLCSNRPASECFPSMETIQRHVKEVQDELAERKGMTVTNVIMTSDEKDDAWWKQVAGMGWHRIDHSETVKAYGHWYPILIDAVVQSNGWGFVGTDQSTMSYLARLRVATWREGATRLVRWT